MARNLQSGQLLEIGTGLNSTNGLYRFIMQRDGNLVLYGIEGPLWSTGTNGKPVNKCIMQTDGNLVLYTPHGAIWATNTHGNPGSGLVMQDDGNVVIYKGNVPLWATGTNRDHHVGKNNKRVSVGTMDGTVTIQPDGKVITEIHIRTGNQAQGFTGGYTAVFFDKNGHCFAETPRRKIGVTPDLPLIADHHERYDRQTDQLTPSDYQKTALVSLILLHDAEVRWKDLERVVQIGKDVAEIYSKFKS